VSATFDEWLALSDEEPIDPEIPIIDSHHHLWEEPDTAPYSAAQFVDDVRRSGQRVEGSIYVECGVAYRTGPEERRSVGETEFATRCAARLAELDGHRLLGIVAHTDLRRTETLRAVLAEHRAVSGGLVRGIRQTALHDPTGSIKVAASAVSPPGLLGDDDLRAGIRTLGELGLVYDTFIYYHQLPELVEMAASAPDTTVVLNHIGGPVGIAAYAGRRAEILGEWRQGIEAVAARPNVMIKLGGIGMPLMGLRWHRAPRPPTSDDIVDAWMEPLRFVIDRFGPERCMFESNFPVDRQSCGYGALWNAYKKMTTDLSVSERVALFSGTATRVYRLAASTG
jgi:predicted TIM-barrel fold metal-dependent hydrolase